MIAVVPLNFVKSIKISYDKSGQAVIHRDDAGRRVLHDNVAMINVAAFRHKQKFPITKKIIENDKRITIYEK